MSAVLTRFTLLCLLILPTTLPAATPQPPSVEARGWLLLDINSDFEMASHNADERLGPASLTKIMTAYVVFRELTAGHIKLNDEVLVSEKAWKTPGSRMFIEVNKKVKLEDLIKGMIIQSGNDASVALAEHIAGSEEAFAQLMNEHAYRLGMLGSHFVNATGLPDKDHYVTARDIAKVTAALIHEFPEYYRWYSQKAFTYNGIKQQNRNLLLTRDKTVDGVKTGHTDAAGYCLVSSAKRDDMRLLSVVMGTKSATARANESQKLLNFGFRFYETRPLYSAGQTITPLRIWKGDRETLPVGLEKALYITVPRGRFGELKADLNLNKTLIAPIAKGARIGAVSVTLDGDLLKEVPVIALRDVGEGSLWHKLIDSAIMWWQHD